MSNTLFSLQVGCILGGLIGAIRGYRRHKSLAGLIRVAVKVRTLIHYPKTLYRKLPLIGSEIGLCNHGSSSTRHD